jgi:hypothetical protein
VVIRVNFQYDVDDFIGPLAALPLFDVDRIHNKLRRETILTRTCKIIRANPPLLVEWLQEYSGLFNDACSVTVNLLIMNTIYPYTHLIGSNGG